MQIFPLFALVLFPVSAAAQDVTALLPSCIETPGITRPAPSDIPDTQKYFPAISQVLGEEGDVLLEFTVGTNGRVSDAKLGNTSGFPRLDAAALAMVGAWRYKPATLNGERAACANKAVVRWTIPPALGRVSPQRMIVPAADSWPAGTREAGVEGVTVVRAEVAPDGSAKTKVTGSSGSRDLDKEAVARVLARPDVKPDMFDGKPVGALYTFYVIWSFTPVEIPTRPVPGATHAPAAL